MKLSDLFKIKFNFFTDDCGSSISSIDPIYLNTNNLKQRLLIQELKSAVNKHDLATLQCLVNKGANIRASSELLFQANQLKIVQFLVEHGANVNVANENNETSLFGASFEGHNNIVKYLLEKGANPSVTSRMETPIFSAIRGAHYRGSRRTKKKYLEIIKNLVESGSDINFLNLRKNSPLAVAVILNEYEISK